MDKKHSEKELLEIYLKHYGSNEHSEFFINHYNSTFDETVEDDGFLEPGEKKQDVVLNYSINYYLQNFIKNLKEGHTVNWSHLIAKNIELLDDPDDAFQETYINFKKLYPDEVNQELIKICKNNGYTNRIFTDYYLEQCKELSETPLDRTIRFFKIYEQQIKKGQSKLFAYHYADQKSEENYTETFCTGYAESFDKAIKEGKSKEYAYIYAEKYGEYIANFIPRHGAPEGSSLFDFGHDRIIANMKAWEYIQDNEVENVKIFMKKYEHIYLNTYHADEIDFNISHEDLDSQILNQTLEAIKS